MQPDSKAQEQTGMAGDASLVDGRLLLAIYAGLTIAALLPLFLVDAVPLANMPNHMARVRILAEIGQDPALAMHYRLNWGLHPNLALDLLLTPLASLVPPLELGRWFTALTMLALIGGTLALHRVLTGRVGLWPIALFLFLYNHVLIWGFLNFLFGLALALWLLAGWIASRDRAGWPRTLLFGLAGVGVFFIHLMALGIYGLLVGLYEVARLRQAGWSIRVVFRDWVLGALQFLPAAALLLYALPPRIAEPEWEWGDLVTRLRGIAAPVWTNLNSMDALLALFVLVVLTLLLLLRWARPAPGMHLPLLLLLVAALAAPFWTYGRFGGVWGLDVRLWVALSFFAVAGFRWCGPRRAGTMLAVLCLGLFLARVIQIGDHWLAYDLQIAEYREATRAIETGARILHVQEKAPPVSGDPGAFRDIYFHFTSYTVLDRSVFLPTLFTDPAKQPIVAAPELQEIDTPVGWPVRPGELRAWADPALFDWFDGDDDVGDQRRYFFMWQDRFDYAVYLHGDGAANPAPELLEPVAAGSFFTIYRVRSGGCTGDYPGSCKMLRDDGRDWRIPRKP
jgi:hypothetical protein